MEDKGQAQGMDMDHCDVSHKRAQEEFYNVETGVPEGATKRTKLSSPQDCGSLFSAEVGDDQPRHSL